MFHHTSSKATRTDGAFGETGHFCMCVRQLLKMTRGVTRSKPAPHGNQDTCKDSKANPLKRHTCREWVFCYKLALHTILLFMIKRSCLPTVCHPHGAFKKLCAGGRWRLCIQTISFWSKKPLPAYTALLFTTCVY